MAEMKASMGSDRMEDFAQAAAKRGGYGFDPTIIIGIISAIMQFIQMCPKPTASAIRNGRVGLFQRARLSAALAQAGVPQSVRMSGSVIDEAIDRQKAYQTGPGGDWCDQMLADAGVDE